MFASYSDTLFDKSSLQSFNSLCLCPHQLVGAENEFSIVCQSVNRQIDKAANPQQDTGFVSSKATVIAATIRNAIGDKDHLCNVIVQLSLRKVFYGLRGYYDEKGAGSNCILGAPPRNLGTLPNVCASARARPRRRRFAASSASSNSTALRIASGSSLTRTRSKQPFC